jgi:hypothetical protein
MDCADLSALWSVATRRGHGSLESTLRLRRQVAEGQSDEAGSPAGQPGWGACQAIALQNEAPAS